MNKTRRLIGLGYLPKELPPEFSSLTLASNYLAVLDADKRPRPARPEVFSLARSGNSRRTLRVTNPIHYVRQADVIGRNWSEIEKFCNRSKLSVNLPRFKAPNEGRIKRATNHGPKTQLPELRLEHAAAHRYVLQADFARFFSSIYSHSIPWALHTKTWAKKNPKGKTGNDLDLALRNGQDRQTVGIPISSDVSHVISELIAAAIDSEAFRQAPAGYRHVDDYFLCFDTEHQAMNALEHLAAAAREYEIDLNYDKTSIKSVRATLEDIGINQIRDFPFSQSDAITTKELSRLFELATSVNDVQENAIKYAIGVVSKRDTSDVDWHVIESYLLRAVTLNPNAIADVGMVFYEASKRNAPLNRKRIGRFFSAIVFDSILFRRDSELVWALWIFKVLAMPCEKSVTALLGKAMSSTGALLALDLQDRSLLKGTLDTSNWASVLTADDLYGEHWLLAYEALTRQWLRASRDIIGANPSFAAMRQLGVTFYDPGAIQAAQHVARVPLQVGAGTGAVAAPGAAPAVGAVQPPVSDGRPLESTLKELIAKYRARLMQVTELNDRDDEEDEDEEIEEEDDGDGDGEVGASYWA